MRPFISWLFSEKRLCASLGNTERKLPDKQDSESEGVTDSLQKKMESEITPRLVAAKNRRHPTKLDSDSQVPANIFNEAAQECDTPLLVIDSLDHCSILHSFRNETGACLP